MKSPKGLLMLSHRFSRVSSPGLIRGLRRLIPVTFVVACVMAPAAHADLRSDADAIMNMDYNTFIGFKQNQHPAPFEWSDDGCSGPWGIRATYANLFNKPCQMHDFGYRNYGHGLALGPNEDTRAWIDGRFATEMRRLCNDSFNEWWQAANKAACLSESGYIWAAVRNLGRSAYYG
jgi:hypothetical protein